jgi:hypothetical protein
MSVYEHLRTRSYLENLGNHRKLRHQLIDQTLALSRYITPWYEQQLAINIIELAHQPFVLSTRVLIARLCHDLI